MWRVLVLVAIALTLIGCREDGVPLAAWTFQADGAPREAIVLPRHFDDRLPRAHSSYVLETTYRPTSDAELDLVVPYVAANVSLSVDGRPAVRVDESDFVEGYRRAAPQRFRIPRAEGEKVRTLALRVEHTWTQSAWFDTIPKILPAGAPDFQSRAVRFLDLDVALFAFAVLSQLALTYLFVFLLDRRRKTYLWFGLQGLTAAYYPFFVMGASQSTVSHFDVNIVAVMIGAAPIAAVYFTHALFELPPPSRFWPALFALALAVSLFAHDPFVMPRFTFVAVASVAISVLYQAVLCAKLVMRKESPSGAGLLLVGWCILGAGAWNDLLAWMGGGEHFGGARGGCAALAAFSLIQTLLLSRQHVRSLADADALNLQLRGRVDALEQSGKEIQGLNDELRRQIGDRSRQLFAALALIGGKIEPRVALEPGSIVQERYRVVREIGQGGMGTVYEVTRVASGGRLALKVASSTSGLELARLAREAQIAATVSHPNVVRILDVDVASEGYLFLVIEYVDGDSLSALRQRGSDVSFTTSVMLQIARGLAALHEKGIVHRDLKPSNVLVAFAEDGSPIAKLADFGISRQLGDVIAGASVRPPVLPLVVVTEGSDQTTRVDLHSRPSLPPDTSHPTPVSTPRSLGNSPLTEAGAIAGTPMYMAPELADGLDALSPAVDIFSFGVIAFELLVGRKPFARPPTSLRLEGRSVPLAPLLRDERPDLDATIADILGACTSLDPELRPTADEIVRALEARVA